MKKVFIYKTLAILVAALTLVTACTEQLSDVRLDPKLSTSQVLNVGSAGATVVGFVIAEGSGITERGVCYDIETGPTVDDDTFVFDGEVTGATFSVTMSGLNYATLYYVKAYAKTASGTIYGDEITFTTLPVGPTVTTAAATEISYTSATGGGEVTVTGGAEITARGVCYGETHNPSVSGSKTSDGTGAGPFVSSLTGLKDGTLYYIRAYATNSAGTSYGPEVSFTTLVPLNRTWYLPGNYVAASYPGFGMGDWAPDQSPTIKSGLSAPDNLEGYVYMAGGANEWKVATEPNWDATNYGDGGGGILSTSGSNIATTAGFYQVKVNASTLAFTVLNTVWGVVGDATPLGWGDNTVLTYVPELAAWTGAVHLTAGEFKFRSNNSWDSPNPNFGSTAGDETLDEGGSNIPVTVADDYAITLDLSHPLAYTYSANRWGIIGGATAGGWDSDQNMSWDAVNGVFTATLDLTAGEFKFRANDAWDVDLGGDIAALTPGGANIPVAADGNYTITLDPWTKVATVTMN